MGGDLPLHFCHKSAGILTRVVNQSNLLEDERSVGFLRYASLEAAIAHEQKAILLKCIY